MSNWNECLSPMTSMYSKDYCNIFNLPTNWMYLITIILIIILIYLFIKGVRK